MFVTILYAVILNLSVLLLFALLITKLIPVKNAILVMQRSKITNIFLMFFFGLLGIFATSSGVTINNSIVNVRTIPVMSGGILFGPVVGIGAGIIAALHRFFFAGNDFTSLACAISTLVGGIIGSLAYKKFKAKKDYPKIILLVALTETLQMILIVLLANPTNDAIELVKTISIPMILINSTGVALFISVFESAFTSAETYTAKKVESVFEITEKSIPYIRKGFQDTDSLDKASHIILAGSQFNSIAFTNLSEIIVVNSKNKDNCSLEIESILTKILNSKGKTTHYDINNYTYISSPLYENDEIIGYLILGSTANNIMLRSNVEFVYGLSRIISVQLELSQIENAQKRTEQAEFAALQSQINPHFLFNILNTIISISRTSPELSREVLMNLSKYFRQTLKHSSVLIPLEEELETVLTYYNLEKARFEDKINLNIEYDDIYPVYVPRFVIQPLVENSIKHGLPNQDNGLIEIKIFECDEGIKIQVIDNGIGIPKDIINTFFKEDISDTRIGLKNVHQRLKTHYSTDGLTITSKPNQGTCASFIVPYQKEV